MHVGLTVITGIMVGSSRLFEDSIVLPISLNAGPWLIPFLALPLTRWLIDFFFTQPRSTSWEEYYH